jgi:cell division protein FtsQ
MWHKPRLMLATADLLWIAGGLMLAAAAVHAVARLPILPIRQVVVVNALREVQRADVEQAISGLRGNLVSVSLDGVRASFEKLPWVRRAEVRRRWPGTLELTLHEHHPVARWGEGNQQLVNAEGEVFYATGSSTAATLPVFNGPLGSAPEILARYRELRELLEPTGRSARLVTLTPRLAWQVRLDDGLALELGREQSKAPVKERLARFVAVYPVAVATRQPKPQVADLRYPNGFVLRAGSAGPVGGVPGSEGQGSS